MVMHRGVSTGEWTDRLSEYVGVVAEENDRERGARTRGLREGAGRRVGVWR